MGAQLMALEKDHSFYYTDIPWRHSGLRARALGVDPIILIVVPLFFITLAREWPTWLFYVYGLFIVAVVYARIRRFPTFFDWLTSLRTRAQGVQWPTR